MCLLSSNQFIHIANDPTKSLESIIQRTLRKIKSKLSEQEDMNLYLTESCPGNFHGTAKIHKLSVNGQIKVILIRQINSNLNTETYNLAKYLSKLLPPLRQSRTLKNSLKNRNNANCHDTIRWYRLMLNPCSQMCH